MTNLDELQALLDAATPGPWKATEGCAVFADGSNLIADAFASGGDQPGAPSIHMPWSQPQCQRNAAVIAASMNALPALLAVARAAEALDKGIGFGDAHVEYCEGDGRRPCAACAMESALASLNGASK